MKHFFTKSLLIKLLHIITSIVITAIFEISLISILVIALNNIYTQALSHAMTLYDVTIVAAADGAMIGVIINHSYRVYRAIAKKLSYKKVKVDTDEKTH